LKEKKVKIERLVIFVTGAILLLAGILLGDNAVIFRKAIFICLECMGIA
jgi:hypothetical protein